MSFDTQLKCKSGGINAPEHGLVRLWKTKRIQQILTSHLANKDHTACRYSLLIPHQSSSRTLK
ncbi:hypothetical protein N7463_006748 [Penicillium fimorum]|uniref:Uncharacterized protein n=1 Tax=Penicillium fimorum TaxID=1882269 RepID=A0A9W9XV12_9EURO|nr:hypothetical protein N7463_006748 [Penicillium fimorum]